MDVAYLVKDVRANHTILVPNQDVDHVALLKARTYLAFLGSQRVLKRENKKSWIRIYYDANFNFEFDAQAFDDPNVVAAVPYRPFMERWEQPGTIAVKSDLESMALFNNVYLKSSINWLMHNPQALTQLQQQFDKRLVSA